MEDWHHGSHHYNDVCNHPPVTNLHGIQTLPAGRCQETGVTSIGREIDMRLMAFTLSVSMLVAHGAWARDATSIPIGIRKQLLVDDYVIADKQEC